MTSTLTTPDRLLRTQVRAQLWCIHARDRLGARMRRDERGDVYSTVIAVAVSVVIAITVGGILFAKFTGKANSIDTDTPVVSIP
ncbi:MAG: hypothetical protein ACR2MO_07580 [Acidimicrobiales bacterium]